MPENPALDARTIEYFEYLDDLRESGETNMYCGRSYLMDEFGLERRAARDVLTHWMSTFGERHPSPLVAGATP